MADKQPWPMIHAERQALVDDLSALTDAQWNTPALCEGWTVRQTLGHMTAGASSSIPKFFAALAGSGFKFDKMTTEQATEHEGATPADTLAGFKAQVSSTSHPPGPVDTWLGETVTHAEDIRRPLGIKHTYDPKALEEVTNFYRGSNLIIGGKTRAKGLTFRATDADWTAGEGPEVAGPGISLVLAITGRQQVLGDLSGDGLATLTERM